MNSEVITAHVWFEVHPSAEVSVHVALDTKINMKSGEFELVDDKDAERLIRLIGNADGHLCKAKEHKGNPKLLIDFNRRLDR